VFSCAYIFTWATKNILSVAFTNMKHPKNVKMIKLNCSRMTFLCCVMRLSRFEFKANAEGKVFEFNCGERCGTFFNKRPGKQSSNMNTTLHQDQGRTQRRRGWSWPLPWAWYFTKTLLPAQRRLIVYAYFLLLICGLNANTTEWICMQISMNIVSGPKSNN